MKAKKEEFINHDDITVLNSSIEYDEDKNLNYLLYEMIVKDNNGKDIKLYKAIKLIRIIRLPKSAKQEVNFMEKHSELLSACWERRINLITIISNILQPVALGLLHCYGVQAVSTSIEEAKRIAEDDMSALSHELQGNYRTMEYKDLSAEEAEWLRDKIASMKNLSMLRGIPQAKNDPGEGGQGIGGRNINPTTLETTEELVAGLSDKEYVIMSVSTPVDEDVLTKWLTVSSKENTKWQSQMQGSSSMNFGINIPMMFMGNLGASQGWSDGSSDSENYGDSLSESDSTSFSDSFGQSESSSHSDSSGWSEGWNTGTNQGVSENFGDGTSQGTSHSFSQSDGTSASDTSSFGQSYGHSDGTSASVSDGTSASSSHSTGVSDSSSYSHGTSDSSSYSHGMSSSDSTSYGTSQSTGYSHSNSSGGSSNYSEGSGYSYGINYGQNQGSSHNWSNSTGTSYSGSTNVGGGVSFGVNANFGSSESIGTSDGSSISYGDSYGMSWGSNSSNSGSNSYSSGSSWGSSDGYSSSSGTSYGVSHSNGTSESWGTSHGTSESWGTSHGTSESWGTSQGVSHSTSNGISSSDSRSLSSSFGHSDGTSASTSIGNGDNQGTSTSHGTGTSAGTSTGYSNGISGSSSDSTSRGTSTSHSSGTGHSNGSGVSWGNGRGTSNGFSSAMNAGTSASMGLGASLGIGKSYQFIDVEVRNIVQIYELQTQRLMDALNGQGAFFTDLYIATPDDATRAAATTLAKSAWQNENALFCPLQVVDLSGEELNHMLYHFAAFSSCNTIEGIKGSLQGYKYSTILLPNELTAYTHPIRLSEGGQYSDIENIPVLAIPSMMKGEIYIGKILSGERWTKKDGYKTKFDYRLSGSENMHHIFFTGESRSGKTVMATRFVVETALKTKRHGKRMRIIVLDPKQDWRVLAKFIDVERFKFYSLGDPELLPIKFNLLKIPKNVRPQIYADGIIESFCRSYQLGEKVKPILRDAIYKSYEEAGCFCKEWRSLAPELSKKVSFARVYLMIKKKMEDLKVQRATANMIEAYERLLDRLDMFAKDYTVEYQMFGQGGDDAVSIDEILGKDDVIVLESFGLDSTFKSFVFGTITTAIWFYCYGHEGGFKSPGQYSTLLVIEEANEVLIGGGDDDAVKGTSQFEKIVDQAAGLELFICAITQKIADMPPSIVANTGLAFSMKISREEDKNVFMNKIGKDPKIDDKALLKFLPKMPTGWCIAKAGRTFDYKDAEPVLVAVDRLDVDPPTNQELKEIMKKRELVLRLKELDKK